MHPGQEHQPLCTIELIAAGHADRCPGADCAFWQDGCVLARVEHELDARPEVARLLLELRHELEAGRAVGIEDARSRLSDGSGAVP